jgi:flagellar motor switch protein FliG
MNRATIHRWLKEPEFIALIDQFRAEIVAESQTLESLVPKAFNTLESLLNGDSGVSASTARVALDVLKAAAQVRNASEQGETSFEQRLRELDLGN